MDAQVEFPDPTLHVHVLSLLETSKRTARKPRNKKDHVSADVINKLFSLYGSSNDPIIVRDLSMIIIYYCCFLRFNELSNIKCSDVKFFEDHLSVNSRKSKTDQYRLGNQVVCSKLNSVSCPYQALIKYINQNNVNLKSEEYLFKPMYRSGKVCSLISKNKKLSYTRTKECLLGKLNSITKGKGNYGLHSFRAGGATAAANSHVLDRCWKRHGRWRSDTSKDGYVADSLSSRLSVTKNLGLE